MNDPRQSARRRFLKGSASLAAGSLLPLATARASVADVRTLSLVHTHTHERIQLVYAVAASYVPEALTSLNRFLRDHYSGEIGPIDPRLFDLLNQVQQLVGGTRPFEVISGYRCPTTNATLRETGGGGVAKNSHRFCPPKSIVTSTLHVSGSVIASSMVYGSTPHTPSSVG